uniref:Uncharacterized protein n=1 Tax=Paraurostyla sp. TaxID=6014 RepID=A0A3Q8BMR5_9STIC|nr:hypothetical protein [Paraurostyla sp.]
MVRRWSHINNINTNKTKSFFLIKRFKYRHLKRKTMIKRFHKKYSKTRRKSFNKLKHSTNFFLLHNIFRFWSIDYFFNKHTIKLTYFNNISINNFLFLNANFIINKNINIYFTWNFFFLNFSKKILLFFSKLSNKNILTIHMPYNGAIKSKAWCIDNKQIQTSDLAFPSYNEYDDVLYPFNPNFDVSLFNINKIFNFFNFKLFLNFKKIYKILILIFFMNI